MKRIVLVFVAICIAGASYLIPEWISLRRHMHSNWISSQQVRRSSTFSAAIRVFGDEVRLNGGQIPESLQTMRSQLEQQGLKYGLDEDDRGDRLFARAVLLKDFTTQQRLIGAPNGATTRHKDHYKWLILALMKKFDPVLTEDLICYGGDIESTMCIPESQARQILGDAAVDAAYARYREDLASASSLPVK